MERNGIHIIDLNKTVAKIDEAAEALKTIAKTGRKILFVATKKQAKDVVAEKAASINMPYVNERWAGGMLTNFPTIRKAVKKMTNIDRLLNDGTFSNLSKRELLQVSRQRAKLEKNLGSIADMARLPVALFVVDVMKEHIAVKEANRLGIPVFGIVDTNSDPKNVDYVIPANDDAKDSVDAILTAVCGAIAEALEERKAEKADDKAAAEQKDQPKKKAARKSGDFIIHCMMDEIGRLHPNNIKGILQFANSRNIYLINSSPTSYNPYDYKYTYLLSKHGVKTRVDKLLKRTK